MRRRRAGRRAGKRARGEARRRRRRRSSGRGRGGGEDEAAGAKRASQFRANSEVQTSELGGPKITLAGLDLRIGLRIPQPNSKRNQTAELTFLGQLPQTGPF